MSKILFAMYNHADDCVEVTLDNQFHVTFNCQSCNAQVKFEDPLYISYLPILQENRQDSMLVLLQGKPDYNGMWM